MAAIGRGRQWLQRRGANLAGPVEPAHLDQSPPGRLITRTASSPAVVTRDPVRALNFFRLPPGSPRSSGDQGPSGGDPIESINWYHTIELPDGRVTNGQFDHRELVQHYGLPEDLSGKRALDVATFDGFWAFRLERLGADEVTAVDLAAISQVDLPWGAERQRIREGVDVRMGAGFEVAKQALGSKVTKAFCSVYDLRPEVLGQFDFVHVADLLLHLRSPMEALVAIRSVTDGQLLLSDVFHPGLTSIDSHLVQYLGGWEDCTWWLPSLSTLMQTVADAGFRNVRLHTTYNLARREDTVGLWRAVISADS